MARISEEQRIRENRYVTIRGQSMWIHKMVSDTLSLEEGNGSVIFFPLTSRREIIMKKADTRHTFREYVLESEVVTALEAVVGSDPLCFQVGDGDRVILRRRT